MLVFKWIYRTWWFFSAELKTFTYNFQMVYQHVTPLTWKTHKQMFVPDPVEKRDIFTRSSRLQSWVKSDTHDYMPSLCHTCHYPSSHCFKRTRYISRRRGARFHWMKEDLGKKQGQENNLSRLLLHTSSYDIYNEKQ